MRNIQQKEEKPLFKMRMFSDIGSKVVEGIKNFKTFDEKNIKNIGSSADPNEEAQIDNMIEKIENELKELETHHNHNILNNYNDF
jgi:hypothetical protein